jgi:hypothetical protein
MKCAGAADGSDGLAGLAEARGHDVLECDLKAGADAAKSKAEARAARADDCDAAQLARSLHVGDYFVVNAAITDS